MRKYSGYFLVIFITLIISFNVFYFFNRVVYHKKVLKVKSTLNIKFLSAIFPSFNRTSAEIKSTVVILFDSQCDYCQHEVKSLLAAPEFFKTANVFFLTSEGKDVINPFQKKMQIVNVNGIGVGNVNYLELVNTFGRYRVPKILVYGKDFKLKKEFSRDVEVDSLYKYTH